MLLKEVFKDLILRYDGNGYLAEELWKGVKKAYSGRKRLYHNLFHIDHILDELTVVKTDIEDWDILLFSIFYHDIVYSPIRKDNEEKSAELAVKALTILMLPTNKIARCKDHIIATRNHTLSVDQDTNFLTDADLSILGAEPDVYESYSKLIRKEYSIFPDLIYNPGRKKALYHFLEMKTIFKTVHFQELYESRARHNIKKEIQSLQ